MADPQIREIHNGAWKELERLVWVIAVRIWDFQDGMVESIDWQPEEIPEETAEETILGVLRNREIESFFNPEEISAETADQTISDVLRNRPLEDFVDPFRRNIFDRVLDDEEDDNTTFRKLGYGAEHHYFLDLIYKAIQARDPSALRTDLQAFSDYCGDIRSEIRDELREADACIKLLEVEQGSLLYAPEIPQLVVPRLIVSVQDELIRLIAREPEYIFKISSRQFEELVAELFIKQGFDVHLTKATRDGGYDIVAIQRHMDITTKFLIECKRYAKTRKVAVDLVRQLFGVKTVANANKAIMVTTSSFTREAIQLAKAHFWDLELKDHDDVISWIRRAS